MNTTKTSTTDTTATPPPPVAPPQLVRLRVDVPGEDYRVIRHIAVDTGTSVNELVCESVRMLRRYYAAHGLPTPSAAP
jgi:hypothetical protein